MAVATGSSHRMQGYTALHIAAFRGGPAAPAWVWHIYKMLATKGASAGVLNARNANGRTALHVAAAHGNVWMVEALLGAGAGHPHTYACS